MKPNFANRTVWTADNLDVLRGLNSECVDLIYLDPPFNSNRTYSAPIGSKAAGAAFKDTWTRDDVDDEEHGFLADTEPALYSVIRAAQAAHSDGMFSYLLMMASRLVEMKRLMKPSGSIYLHCDPTASHYLKLVMDAVFGAKQFRSEVVWQRDPAGKGAKRTSRQWPRNHDLLIHYSRGKGWRFRQAYTELTARQKKPYRHKDSRGFFKAVQRGDYSDASMERFRSEDRIYTSKHGKEYIKHQILPA